MSSGVFIPQFGEAVPFRTVLEYLVYVAVLVLVTVIVTLWIVSTRVTLKTSDRESHTSRRRLSSPGWLGRWLGRGGGSTATGGKRRRRRRAHRRRNPTLAETGGLPPIRNHSSAPGERPRP